MRSFRVLTFQRKKTIFSLLDHLESMGFNASKIISKTENV